MGKLNRMKRVLRKRAHTQVMEHLSGFDRDVAGFAGCTCERDPKTGERKVYVSFTPHHGKFMKKLVSELYQELKPDEVIMGSYDKYKKKKRKKKRKKKQQGGMSFEEAQRRNLVSGPNHAPSSHHSYE